MYLSGLVVISRPPSGPDVSELVDRLNSTRLHQDSPELMAQELLLVGGFGAR